MPSDEQLDRLIRDALKEMVDSSETPDLDLKEAWKRLQNKLRQKRLRNLATRSLSVVALLLLCFGTLAAVAPHPVKAIGARIWSGFTTIIQGNSSATIQYGLNDNPGPRTPPPLLRHQRRSSCPKVSKATFLPIGQSGGDLDICYTSGSHLLDFRQNCAPIQGSGFGYDTDDTTVSNITVRGRPGKQLYTPGKHMTSWIWTDGDISCQIDGPVTPTEMRQVVSSMKVVNP